jgi:NitT/TauT family transport system permease protein
MPRRSWIEGSGFPVAVIVGIVLILEAVCAMGWISPLLLAAPSDTLGWLVANANDSGLYHDIGITLRRVSIAFFLSAAIGIPLGSLMGSFRSVERALRFPVDFSRSIPATALFPLFLIFFGAGEGPRVAAAVYGASLIITMSTMSGIKQASATRLKAARMFGASGWKMFTYVLIPEALPSILTGLRLGVSLAFVIIVLVEMFVGTSAGIGHRLIEAQIIFEIPHVYGMILIAGFIGYAMNRLFVLLETRVSHYVGQ